LSPDNANRRLTAREKEPYRVRELIEEAQRVLEMRRRLYPRCVRDGRMKQQDATRRIELMEAIMRPLTRTASV
jgi:hypothetical protein